MPWSRPWKGQAITRWRLGDGASPAGAADGNRPIWGMPHRGRRPRTPSRGAIADPERKARMSTAVRPRRRTAAPDTGAPRPADVFVVFGISGDLAKVMTFHSLYRLERRGLLNCPILGVAADDWTVDHLRAHARTCIADCGEAIDDEVFDRFAARLSYLPGDFGDDDTYRRVAGAIGEARSPVFYLEIPPSLFGTVIKGLADAGLTGSARVVVEKPFGHDAASAAALNEEVHQYLDESQLYRIDHFLGKMGLVEILYLRFREHDVRADLEPQLRLVRADHHGRELRGRGSRPLLRPCRRPSVSVPSGPTVRSPTSSSSSWTPRPGSGCSSTRSAPTRRSPSR